MSIQRVLIIEKRERRGGRGRFSERSIITSTLNKEKSANSGSCSEQGPVIEWKEGENKRRGRIDYLLSHWRKANISISGLCSLSLSLSLSPSLSIARHKTVCRLCIENAMASSTTTAIVVKKQLQRQWQRQRQRQHQQTTPQWPKRTIIACSSNSKSMQPSVSAESDKFLVCKHTHTHTDTLPLKWRQRLQCRLCQWRHQRV